MPEWPKPAEEPDRAPQDASDDLFRAEAVRHRRRAVVEEGRPLHVIPPWLDSAYRMLAVLGIVGLGLTLTGSSTEYATGPAVVRLSERIEINARTTGTVDEILVAPGERVAAGQVLGRLEQSRELAEVEKLQRELRLRLIERLRVFDAQPASSGLDALEEDKRLAEARLDLLTFRSPQDGVLGDLLLRRGKLIEAGQLAFTVVSPTEHSTPTVLVLFPGRYRPLLAPGMPLRLRLNGYQDHSLPLTLGAVSASVVSAQEARSIVGPGATPDVGPGAGGNSHVLVRADLPAAYFEISGRVYPYFDGLRGMVEAPVRSRRLVAQLFPWARRVGGG